ncbi:hypothetical protein FBU59_000039 [Linderina macrospora]|uniref:Uncharacterized protein n=1 Tax=Linderina macrospora TaxID=4868 RepID=A0ACC1JI08_9FUNG|nr:hypothetical protein FBU59_000039 [Linderina macrospora]
MEFAAGSSSSEAPATTTKPQMVEIKRRDRNSAPPHRRRSQGSSRRTKSSSSERSKQSLAEQQAPAAVQPEPHIVAAQTLPATQGTGIHAPKTSSLGAVPQSAADETRALAQPRSRRANTLEPARSRMPKSDEVKKHNQEWTKDGKPVIRRHQAVELLMRTSGENLGDEEIVPRDDNERHNFESYLTDAGYDLAGVSITESDIGSFVLSELDDAPDRDAHNYVIRKDGKEVSIKDPSEGSKVGMAEAAKEAVALAAANAEARSASPAAQESAEVVSFSDLLNNDVFGSWTSSGQPTQANTAAPSTVHSSRHLMMVPVEADASGFLLEPLQELSESTASIHTSNIAAQQASQGSQPDTSDKPSVPEVVTGKGSDEADFRMNLLRRRSNGLNVSAARTGTMPQYQFPTQPDPVVVDGQPDSNTITVQYAITEPPLQTADQSSLPEGMPSFYRPGHNDKAGDCCEVPPDCSALFPKLSTTPSFFSAGRRNSMTEPTRPEPWASPGALPKTTSGLRRRRATVTGNTSGLVTKLATKETLGQSTALETASGLDHDTKVSGAPPGGSKAELKHRSQRASTAHSRSPTLPTATVETHKAGVKRTPPLVPPLPPQL